MKSILDHNMNVLRIHYPLLADKLAAYPDKSNICIFKAQDGGVCYGLRQNGSIRPVTDHIAPLTRIQNNLTRMSGKLIDFTKPVLIVGLYPGDELLYIFDLSEKNPVPHAKQRLYVCIDSLACLLGLLISCDVRHIIRSERTSFFWHEDVEQVMRELRQKPESPYIFTLITGASNRVLNKVMPPFVQLKTERTKETQRLQEENNFYYNSITDKQLFTIISGAGYDAARTNSLSRKPRFMTTTCSWSTVVQYSARDICDEFKNIGWDIRHLQMTSMLTPYYLAKQINEFKPDLFMFINHLRTEAQQAYPDNMLFMTWIQDTNPLINKLDSALAWNKAASAIDSSTGKKRKRDLILGYIGQLRKYNYLEDRLYPVNMIVNTKLFKPRELSDEHLKKYACDVCFASHSSKVLEIAIREQYTPIFKPFNFEESLLLEICDHLWKRYREDATFTTYSELEKELYNLADFQAAYSSISEHDRDQVIQLLFWRINDAVYRQVVLEWCDEIGVDLKIYGRRWEYNPRFAKYAAGELKHGEELSIAYQCARYCLHLNSAEGTHQRLLEIMASGGTPLTRYNRKATTHSKELSSAFRKYATNTPLTEPERKAWNGWIFSMAIKTLRKNPGLNIEELNRQTHKSLRQIMFFSTTWMMPDEYTKIFENKAGLTAILQH